MKGEEGKREGRADGEERDGKEAVGREGGVGMGGKGKRGGMEEGRRGKGRAGRAFRQIKIYDYTPAHWLYLKNIIQHNTFLFIQA